MMMSLGKRSESVGNTSDSDKDMRVSNICLSVIKCLYTTSRDEDWHRFSDFQTYITNGGKNYKVMVDGGVMLILSLKHLFRR